MKLLKWLSICIILMGALVLGAFFTVAMLLAPKNMDETLKVDAASQFFDKDGKAIYTTISAERRLPITLKEIPKQTQQAFIAIEDNRFYEHGGIDYRGTLRALISNLRGQEIQGGSTITQQLAKNAFLTQERTLTRKVKEAILAKQLENRYTKDEILEMYLNRIYFGEGAYGVESAALYYFGKHAKELNLAESAQLAAIPKSPNYYNPFADKKASKERQELVLDQMVKYGYITQATADKTKTEELVLATANNENNTRHDGRSYFFDYIIGKVIDKFGADALYKGGLKVYTTLDPVMQQQAEAAATKLPEHYTDGQKRTQPQLGLIAVDPQTGYIKAMVGGRGQDKFNRATQAVRQPGSSFKPFVYLTRMSLDRKFTSASIIKDEPVTFGSWSPQNYGRNFNGEVSVRTALKRSLNVPAVIVANQAGPANIIATAKSLGISTLVEQGAYNDETLAMALGGLTQGVTPLEMAAAYGAIGHNGVYVTPTAITKILNSDGKIIYEYKAQPKQAVSAAAAYQVTNILQDVLVSGTAAGSGIGRPAAGKTGTTDTYKDAWFVGYTPNLSCAVWVGDDNNESMGVVTGSSYPLTVWHAFMSQAVQALPVENFIRPEGAVIPPEPVILSPEEKKKKEEEEKAKKEAEERRKKGLPPVVSNKPIRSGGPELSTPPQPKKPATQTPSPQRPTAPAPKPAPSVGNKPVKN